MALQEQDHGMRELGRNIPSRAISAPTGTAGIARDGRSFSTLSFHDAAPVKLLQGGVLKWAAALCTMAEQCIACRAELQQTLPQHQAQT